MTENRQVDTQSLPYAKADIDLLLEDSNILRDIAKSAVANSIPLRVRGMDADALEALLYDAVVALEGALL